MIRITLIVAALLSGHHHVTVTQPNGAGYMTTALFCRPTIGSRKVLCRNFHIVVKARFDKHAIAHTRANSFGVRRAFVYNAEGRLSGWVDWRHAFQGAGLLIGTFRVNSGEGEVWQ